MTRTPAKKPLRADAERNRLRILEAAADEFAERGLAVSMDDIAARAGVGVGTVYRRFANREELVNTLFEERLVEFAEMAERADQNPDAWEGLIGFLREGSEFHGRNRALRELMFSAPGGREWVDRIRNSVRPIVARVVKRAQEQGKLRTDFATLDVPLIELMLAQIIEFTADAAPDAWRRLLTFVVDGLRAQPGEPTPLESKPLTASQVQIAMERASHSR